MTPPLRGLKVLDFSNLVPGPLAGLILAEAGAEVTKVERPGGDAMRAEASDFAMLNRGKRSIEIDLKCASAVRRLEPLLRDADILIEQFRPGVMDRLGLGYEAVAKINPRIVYCSINGYGSHGSKAHAAGHDLTYVAETGLLLQAVGSDGAPAMPRVHVADIGGGTYPALINILLALYDRERSGHGTRLEIAMYDGVFPFLYPAFASAFGRGQWPRPGALKETGGFPRYSIYRTGDDRFLAIAVTEEKFWVAFRAAIGLANRGGEEPDSAESLRKAIADIILSRSAAEWESILKSNDLPCSVVKTFEEAVQSPLFAERRILGRKVWSGETALPALPVPVAEHFREPEETRPAPALGESNFVLLGPSGKDA